MAARSMLPVPLVTMSEAALGALMVSASTVSDLLAANRIAFARGVRQYGAFGG